MGNKLTGSVRFGLILFALGTVFITVDVATFFVGGRNTPLWLNLLCACAPIGFAIAVWGTVRVGRAEQRQALDELG